MDTALFNQNGFFNGLSGLPDLASYPVSDWNPPFCGMIDMVIRANGDWHYKGTPILRPAMVRLFSQLLRREGDDYFLVTPVEKVGIIVEDVPFIAVEFRNSDDMFSIRTNRDEVVTIDDDHPMRFDMKDGFKPYILVRDGLEARFSRSLTHELLALCHLSSKDGRDWLGVTSKGTFYALIDTAHME